MPTDYRRYSVDPAGVNQSSIAVTVSPRKPCPHTVFEKREKENLYCRFKLSIHYEWLSIEYLKWIYV